MVRTFTGYQTFEEASDAFAEIIKKYGIDKSKIGTGFPFYQLYYKEDPKLPSNPHIRYGNVWKEKDSWIGFFKKNKEEMGYYTFEEAVQAIQKLLFVPKTPAQYRQWRKKDPRLPSNPRKHYSDFEDRGGWDALLLIAEIYINKNPRYYESAEKARRAVHILGIVNEEDYRLSCWQDSCLPPNLREYYGSSAFLKAFGSGNKFS